MALSVHGFGTRINFEFRFSIYQKHEMAFGFMDCKNQKFKFQVNLVQQICLSDRFKSDWFKKYIFD